MNLVQWVDVVVKLVTNGAFITLVLGVIGFCVFSKPLRKRIGQMTKFNVMGDALQAEFDSQVSALEQGAAEIATPENRGAVEELIRKASLIGYNMRADGIPEPPRWEISWKDGKPDIAISVETMGAILSEIDRRRRPLSPSEGFWARKLWGHMEQRGDTRRNVDGAPPG